MPTHLLSRKDEAAKFSRIPRPPKACSAFFVSNWSDGWLSAATTQTDAMMVAQQYSIPTINGLSSWFPNGWGLITAAKGHLAEEASDWALQNGLSEGLCALDMTSGVRSPVDVQRHDVPRSPR